MTRPTVALADDDVLFGSALAVVLADAGYDVVAQATSCQEAREQLAALPSLDLLLTSSTLPGDRAALGRDATDRPLRLIVLSPVTEHAELVSALDHGAQGYLGKDARLSDLLGSVAAVLRGEAAVPRHMLGGLLHELVQQRRRATAPSGESPLSRREQEVLELLAQGHSQEGIARALVISPQTARTHIQKVIGKLGAHSRVEAVAVAVERGLVTAS